MIIYLCLFLGKTKHYALKKTTLAENCMKKTKTTKLLESCTFTLCVHKGPKYPYLPSLVMMSTELKVGIFRKNSTTDLT
jgi:hypothetical protein